MRLDSLKTRTWCLISLLSLVGAIFFWRYGNEYEARQRARAPKEQQPPPAPSTNKQSGQLVPLMTRWSDLMAASRARSAAGAPFNSQSGQTEPAKPASTAPKGPPYRLSNTTKAFRTLAQQDGAILLNNAWIDTTAGLGLEIPENLRAPADANSYVVQSRGPITARFRAILRGAGAEIVSYIPNNAYLVRLSAQAAGQLNASSEIQAVLPFEPYFKLEPKLLALAVEQKLLPEEQWLRVTFFPGTLDSGVESVRSLGAEMLREETTPFGPQVLIRPPAESLSALARLDAVQMIEPVYQRALLNDLLRVTLGISTNGSNPTNYMGLTGTNVLVNVNDTGIDRTHPDLAGRVFLSDTNMANDVDGHGTHIAGIIAGSGVSSASVTATPGGSGPSPNFRGVAPRSRILGVPLEFTPGVSDAVTDTYLQETAARTNALVLRRRTAAMISNNSWFYTGANEYDSAAAQYDAAVRDALPRTANPQPMVYVFGAGASGGGSTIGLGGDPNTIPSPGTAKNVITVGALEHPRFLTNGIVSTNNGVATTNMPFLEITDSDNQVAAFSGRGNIGLGIEGEFGRFKPDLVAPGTMIISARSRQWQPPVGDDEFTQIFNQLNEPLAPNYRYEAGSSMAAASVSGTLALMQEFFEQRRGRTNSPALMKAALINGARSAGGLYDSQVQGSINHQGWGMPSIQNIVLPMMLTQPESAWPIRHIDQSPTNAVATGEAKSWEINLSTNAQQVPLRVTLVWTDPPGNPMAGLKLVNDLDLVVSNTITHQVYYGNNIPAASDFTPPSETNSPPIRDLVNNVENVFIREPFASNFVVSVIGRRVNVNAVTDFRLVTAQTNDVAQDYALVISSGDVTLTNAFTLARSATPPPPEPPPVINMTNGIPILKQRVGAQPPALSVRDGVASQWNFFTFTNTFYTNSATSITNGTNVAFVTFSPPNLSRPRNREADLDLYVSTDPGLLTLQRGAVDGALKSSGRGGTEFVVLTNAALDQVFYIGVKSEDHQGSEFGLIAFSSNFPFDEQDGNNRILRAFPVPSIIPDGSSSDPGGVQLFAIGLLPNLVQRVTVTNVLFHENFGDLIGILSHDGTSATLNNHTFEPNSFFGTNVFVYDDSTFGTVFGSRRSDGPGNLNDFVGAPGNGVWMFNMVDNSPAHTGRVENLTIRVEPLQGGDLGLAGAAGLDGVVGPGQITTFIHDVPPEATNLLVRLTQLTGPVQVYLRREALPSTNQFDKTISLNPPGGELTLGLRDEPEPLLAGRYFITVFNPGFSEVRFHIVSLLELSAAIDSGLTLRMTNTIPLLDDAVTTSSFFVRADKQVTDLQVGLRVSHARASDLAVYLVSPQGTRVLLTENRGGASSQGFGAGFDTNTSYTIFTEQTNRFPGLVPIKFATAPYTNLIGGGPTPIMFDGFENSEPGEYLSNMVVSGWTVMRGRVYLHGPNSGTGVSALTGTNFLELDTRRSPAGVIRTFDTVPGSDYLVTFGFHRNPDVQAGNSLQLYFGPPDPLRPPTKFVGVPAGGWNSTSLLLRARSAVTALEISALSGIGPLIDDVVVSDVTLSTNTFVLPEESLNVIRGERTLGEWRLEVEDTRRGSGGQLLSWQLQLKYGEPRRKAIVLRSGVPYTGTLTNNQTNYFVLDVCQTTTVADVQLIGPQGLINLLADRSGLPTGRVTTDDLDPLINTGGDITNGVAQLRWTTNSPLAAPLLAGRQQFLAVHNLNLGETNSYSIQVVFDRDECHTIRPIIVLTNNVAFTNSIPPEMSVLDNYVFNVSSNALGVNFDLIPRNGDLGLVARFGLPVPDLVNFDYMADQPGITNELIFINTTSAPVALRPGDWYVSVFTKESAAVDYVIQATEYATNGMNIINLTNAVPLEGFISSGARPTNYFRFVVSAISSIATFELYNLNRPAEFLLDINRLPPSINSMRGMGSPTNNVRFDFTPAQPGEYLMSVVNQGLGDLLFTIKATVPENNTGSTNDVYIDPRIQIFPTEICLSWGTEPDVTYRVEAKTNITDSAWTVWKTFVASDRTARECIPRPTDLQFFRIVQQASRPATGTPVPINRDIRITDTEICFSWVPRMGVRYRVEGRTNITDRKWEVLDTVAASNNTNLQHCIVRPTPFQFFQVVEESSGQPPPPPPPPPGGTNRFIDPAVNISSTNICLSWVSKTGTVYRVEAKTNITDAAWSVLDSRSATVTNSTYCVDRPTGWQFFQVVEQNSGSSSGGGGNQQQGVVLGSPTMRTDGRLEFTFTSVSGRSYELQAATNIVSPPPINWITITNVTATGTNTTLVDPTPATNSLRFYRLHAP